MRIGDTDVVIEGHGEHTLVMIHGWPDTYRLWDQQVGLLKEHYRCVRFNLPGFDATAKNYALSLDSVIERIHTVIEQVSPEQPVILMLHDWGCVFGYEFALRYPQRVAKIIGIDVGDVSSPQYRAEQTLSAQLMTFAYQVWLALAWWIGGRTGNSMARWLSGVFRVPAPREHVHSQMGYPYALAWFGIRGGLSQLRPLKLFCPLLFCYGNRKPFMFHSHAWLGQISEAPGSEVIAFNASHWVMLEQPDAFYETVTAWLER